MYTQAQNPKTMEPDRITAPLFALSPSSILPPRSANFVYYFFKVA